MKKSLVKMVCMEISRAEVIIEHEDTATKEEIKDMAWAQFDDNMTEGLEQDNHTMVEELWTGDD